VFWRSTFYEFTAALSARFGEQATEGLSSDRLAALMSEFPD
jgi:hypothetical protein